MRGTDKRSGELFSYVDLEQRVRADHPLRAIRSVVSEALDALSREFAAMYSGMGRPSIAPEMLLRAMLLQAFYSVRSERQLMERLEYDLLFRWFVGLGVDKPVWDHSTFSKNHDPLLDGDVAARFLSAILAQPRVRRLLSSDHFSVDGTLVEAWASMKSFRPKDDRAVPGHWEGDLILGLGSSAIGTLVERTTRFTMLLHLPRMEGHGAGPSIKNGPALAGHGAGAVRDAITRTITTLPEELRRSLTWDQGAEMAQHARLKVDAGVQVYFCDPQSPWQRGSNENTNGLLRQYFPKGTDLSAHSPEAIAAVAATLNARPRKTLGWKTPAEALDECLSQINKHRVATTG